MNQTQIETQYKNSIFVKIFAFFFAAFSLSGRWSLDRVFLTTPVVEKSLGLETFLEVRVLLFIGMIMSMVPLIHFWKTSMIYGKANSEYSMTNRSEKTYISNVFILQLFLLTYFIMTAFWMFYTDEMFYKAFELIILIVYLCITYRICQLPNVMILVKIIWKYFFVIATILMVISIPSLFAIDTTTERASVLGGGANVFIRFIAICLIQTAYSIIRGGNVSSLLLLPFLFAGMIISGSRGGMVSIFVAMFAFMIFQRLITLRMFTRTIGIGIASIAIVVVALIAMPTLYDNIRGAAERRIEKYTLEDLASSGREDVYPLAWRNSWDKPFFGHGIGGWIYYESDDFTYPHNHELELFYEGGLVAVVMFMIILFLVCRRILYLHQYRLLFVPVATCLVFIFFAVQFSSDFFGTRYMYSMMLLAGLANNNTDQ